MRRVRTTWLALGLWALSAPIALAASPRTITVTGEGKATSPPDMATIHTGVVNVATDASEALASNNEAMQLIIRVLQENKVAATDIQTSRFTVQPEYERNQRGQTRPRITGYRVTNQVQVRVRRLADLGKVLDGLVRAGSNRVSGISFGIDDPTEVLNQARIRAIADAQNRAEVYARAAGVRVGKVLTISEQSVRMPRPQHMAAEFAMQRAAAVPIATGEQELRTSIHVVFALEDAE